jgi:hypothetical protein
MAPPARTAAALLSALVLAGAAVRAQEPTPTGPEFQVNTFTSGNQGAYLRRSHDVCAHADGSFVVVWQGSFFQDGDASGIFGQRYDSAGTRLGTEFQVNGWTTGAQYTPDLACLDDGGFVVVWDGLAAGGYGIQGRRFDAAGTPATGDFDVDGFSEHPASVAPLPGAGFVVATAPFGAGYEVHARRFGSDGGAMGGPVVVNADTENRVRAPRVDTDPAGNFVVVWDTRYTFLIDRVLARRFASSGAPLGTEFQVNEYTSDSPEKPDVSVADDGSFVVAWTSN